MGNNASVSKQKAIQINSFHVSCKSDRPPQNYGSDEYVGIVLYSKGGKTSWKCNGVKCKSGYIILLKAENLQNIESTHGVYGAVYKSIFDEELNESVILSRFTQSNSEVSAECEMGAMEQLFVEKAIKAWVKNKQQNIYLVEPLWIYPNNTETAIQ